MQNADLIEYLKLNVVPDARDSKATIQTLDALRSPNLRGSVKPVKRWNRVKKIGQGSFAIIWLEQEDGNPVNQRAIKVLNKREHDETNIDFTRELSALARFSKHQDLFGDFYG